jgi:multidrug efflux pump subunit AcrA (membrane-fusion protein)
MKLRQIIIIGSLLGVLGFIFYSVTKNDQREKKEAKEKKLDTQFFEAVEVQNIPHQFSLVSYGQIEANQSLTLSPQVSGRLLKGAVTLKPGVQFRKGQLLYKIENTEALYNLNSRKSSYINMIGSIMPDISLDFPNEKEKWLKYLNSIRLDENIPGLPQWESGKEKLFLASKNVLSEYFNIKALETNISKYYSFAPFNGTITDKYVEPGATVGMGSQIIKIVKTGDYELKIPVKSQEIDLVKSAGLLTLIDASGKNIGAGKILRVSNVLNASTQSIDIYLKVIPNEGQVLYNGMYINVSLGSEQQTIAVALPKRALDNDKVYLFDTDTSFIQKLVQPIHYFSDSVLVTGLKDGSKVMPSTPDFYNKNAPVQLILKK